MVSTLPAQGHTLLFLCMFILHPSSEQPSGYHLPTSYSPNQSSPLSLFALLPDPVSLTTSRRKTRRFGSLRAATDSANICAADHKYVFRSNQDKQHRKSAMRPLLRTAASQQQRQDGQHDEGRKQWTSCRAAVIGAGAAGLAAAKKLREEGHEVTLFEQAEEVGGMWRYEWEVEDDLLGVKSTHRVHSSVYASLHTTLPRKIMAFADMEFGNRISSLRFPHHSAVQTYLQEYAERFSLKPLVRFSSKVTRLRPLAQPDGRVTWELTYSHINPASDHVAMAHTEIFDVVAVCNGHHSEPSIAAIDGADTFPGLQMHSHNYRQPSAFKAKRVLVVGAAASGRDISREIAGVADQVFVSARRFAGSRSYSNLVRKPPVKSISELGVVSFEDGSDSGGKVDAIVYCTGYKYHFPFLDGTDVVTVADNFIHPLYLHIFPPSFPSIAFIGIPAEVIPFPQFEVQAWFVARVWGGKADLPAEEEMMSAVMEEEARKRRRGLPVKYYHVQGASRGFDYNNMLLRWAGLPTAPAWRRYEPNRTYEALVDMGWPLVVIPLALCGIVCGIALALYAVFFARGEKAALVAPTFEPGER